MAIKDSWIICDHTGIILNDGVTIYPGYIEITDNELLRFDTNDPFNEIAKYKPWTLHNRVEYMQTVSREPYEGKLNGKHFISKKALKEYVKEQKLTKTH